MKIFFSVGEPSGDFHGANLIRALSAKRPGCEFVGFGGPQMSAAGCELHEDLTKMAIIGVIRAVKNIRFFFGLLSRAEKYFDQHKPDAVVLIDYPGFNWWIARAAKKRGIPVFYYGVPQLWAWAGWRIKKLKRSVDHVLCKLPFEEQWYRERGCAATFVGHPFYDETSQHKMDHEFIDGLGADRNQLVAILPGSRSQEVRSNLHWFLKAARSVRDQVPESRFAIAALNEKLAEIAREALEGEDLPVEIHIGRTPELIQASICCMACSGSVSLQLLYYEKPTVILYWIDRFSYFIQGFFRTVKYITLVNMFEADDLFSGEVAYDPDSPAATAVPFPEYLTCEDKSEEIAAWVVRWLSDTEARQAKMRRLRELRERYAHSGASATAAEYIINKMEATEGTIPDPHFRTVGSRTDAERRC